MLEDLNTSSANNFQPLKWDYYAHCDQHVSCIFSGVTFSSLFLFEVSNCAADYGWMAKRWPYTNMRPLSPLSGNTVWVSTSLTAVGVNQLNGLFKGCSGGGLGWGA